MWAFLFYLLTSKFITYKYNKKLGIIYFLIDIISEIYLINSLDIKFYIIFQILLFQSITDITNNDVYLIPNIAICLIPFIFNEYSLFNTLISFLLPLVIYLISKLNKGIGDGDIELLICLCFLFDIKQMCYICLIASTLNIIFSLHQKRNIYPFVPFISIATTIVYLMS